MDTDGRIPFISRVTLGMLQSYVEIPTSVRLVVLMCSTPAANGKRPLAAALFEDFGTLVSFSGALPPRDIGCLNYG